MKKFIVLVISIIVISLVFSSCASYIKCPAYGHYSQLETTTPDESHL
ncbi:MAG TPA: hypothetical protein P5134_05715 [Bacteroidales bacterium]|nr:hypothetical protein [Bacteroidales bacterium]HOS57564.1 hypothetical protein [Bacteroidales bacterium]HRR05056.1 hypothetical protein [Bacteroidales bacterium]HRT14085.1 hypothetical protein [Bacteroidales bacterium]